MAKPALLDLLIQSFETGTEIKLNKQQEDLKLRLQDIIEIKLEDVTIGDSELYQRVKLKYPFLSFSQLCNDVSVSERIIAYGIDKTADPAKTWIRYLISEVNKKAIRMAERKGDPYTMSYASNILGKHHATDRDDVQKVPYDEIVPFVPEITQNPEVIGISPIKDIDEVKKKMIQKFGLSEYFDDAEIVKNDKT